MSKSFNSVFIASLWGPINILFGSRLINLFESAFLVISEFFPMHYFGNGNPVRTMWSGLTP